ncbi:putative membrane protein [Pseudomonas frederiksbergensis]|uniref:superinfection immunity protein n=1 Tax=Pseudomonas frederiksbergensis TaxID=104087 RepID=UPI003D1B1B19
MDKLSPVLSFAILALVVAVYFLPTLVAYRRYHPNGTSIAILNLFLGWTFIGWLAALIWSASAITKLPMKAPAKVKTEDKYQKLEKLGALKERGLISDDEYQKEKTKLLDG